MKSLQCPSCAANISALQLRQEFACHTCGAQLQGKYTLATLALIALWSLADLVLMLVVESALPGNGQGAFLLRVVLSLAIGAVLFVYCLPAWSSVSRKHDA